MGRDRIKDIPVDEQPYHKCLSKGATSLSDAELLAVLLRTGTREKNSIELARELLSALKSSLLGLMDITPKELMRISGIGEAKAVQLLCVGEISKRIARTRALRQPALTSPGAVAEYYMEQLRYLKVEQVWLSLFDTKNQLIASQMISQGTVNGSMISPREVMIVALRHEAVSMILVHNHPSGDASPSQEDILLTNRMQTASDFVGIALLDHIIIGNHCYVSLKEHGMIR